MFEKQLKDEKLEGLLSIQELWENSRRSDRIFIKSPTNATAFIYRGQNTTYKGGVKAICVSVYKGKEYEHCYDIFMERWYRISWFKFKCFYFMRKFYPSHNSPIEMLRYPISKYLKK